MPESGQLVPRTTCTQVNSYPKLPPSHLVPLSSRVCVHKHCRTSESTTTGRSSWGWSERRIPNERHRGQLKNWFFVRYCAATGGTLIHARVQVDLGTSWLRCELPGVRVDVDASWRVRVDWVTRWVGYELTLVRVVPNTRWPRFKFASSWKWWRYAWPPFNDVMNENAELLTIFKRCCTKWNI